MVDYIKNMSCKPTSVSTAAEFANAIRANTRHIILKADLTISEALSIITEDTAGILIDGKGHKITISTPSFVIKPGYANSMNYVFLNTDFNITASEGIQVNAGCYLLFKGCSFVASGDIFNVTSLIEIPVNTMVSFEGGSCQCNRICTVNKNVGPTVITVSFNELKGNMYLADIQSPICDFRIYNPSVMSGFSFKSPVVKLSSSSPVAVWGNTVVPGVYIFPMEKFENFKHLCSGEWIHGDGIINGDICGYRIRPVDLIPNSKIQKTIESYGDLKSFFSHLKAIESLVSLDLDYDTCDSDLAVNAPPLTISEFKNLILTSKKSSTSLGRDIIIEKSYVKLVGTFTTEEDGSLSVDKYSVVNTEGSFTVHGMKQPNLIEGKYTDTYAANVIVGTEGTSANEQGMTNEVFLSFVDKFKDRIFFIMFDNSSLVYLGYPEYGITVDDLLFRTVNGTDFIGIRRTAPEQYARTGKHATWISWHVTSCVQYFGVLDDPKSRPTPNIVYTNG